MEIILTVFVFNLISMCAAGIIYHEPIDAYDYGYPIYSKYPPYPPYPYYYGPYKHDFKYDALWKKESFGEELKDYWNVFVETFKKSYKEITKPYIVEREVPVPVPVPIERVRTVIKERPVFIKSRPKIVYRKITFSKPHS